MQRTQQSDVQMAHVRHLNARDRPPEPVRQLYKKYAKMTISDIKLDAKIVDLGTLNPESLPGRISVAGYMSGNDLRMAFDRFLKQGDEEGFVTDIPVFAHEAVSGSV